MNFSLVPKEREERGMEREGREGMEHEGTQEEKRGGKQTENGRRELRKWYQKGG